MVKPMVAKSLRWTIRDLDALPDDGGWKRYEIIDGELYVTRAPHIRHQGAAGKIAFALEAWSRLSQLGSPFQTPGVIFTPEDVAIPDVVWVSRDRLTTSVDEAGHLTAAPELVIEILLPGDRNEQHDKEVKLKLYSRHGVQEYWVVSWERQTVEVYRRQDAQLHLAETLLGGDTLPSPLLPECSTPLAAICQ